MSVVPAPATLPVPVDRPRASEQERYYFASQWQLIWWRLRRHRFAMLSFWFLVVL
jgi:peptide/nickel transport system permease protein